MCQSTLPLQWELYPTEKVLIFDDATALCANSPHRVEHYTQYDWVGAAWKWAKEGSPFAWGGNGALSIRSVKHALAVLHMELLEQTKNNTSPQPLYVTARANEGAFM